MDFFCIINSWKGPIVNNEPDKCDDLQFFAVDNLPENTIEHVRYVSGVRGEHLF